jgi:hypothetical protein
VNIAEAINSVYLEGSARKMGEQGHKKFGNKLLSWDTVIAKLMDAMV